MKALIDTKFNVYSDTPAGKDPDSHSPTLRAFHKILWSRQLPSGKAFDLRENSDGAYLFHESELGEFRLSSDAIGHTYSRNKKTADIVRRFPQSEIEEFFSTCSTIGAYIVFPSNKVDRKMTINGARGLNRLIGDRFDLTLECIRLHYAGLPSPLDATLVRYKEFFDVFQDFDGYITHFLLQDLVSSDFRFVEFFLPCEGFQRSPFPQDVAEYGRYKSAMVEFIASRNRRIVKLSLP